MGTVILVKFGQFCQIITTADNVQSWQKIMAKIAKTALSLTPQAMYNQFKRPSAGSVSELYYIYRKT